jgi:hypothetical protein
MAVPSRDYNSGFYVGFLVGCAYGTVMGTLIVWAIFILSSG